MADEFVYSNKFEPVSVLLCRPFTPDEIRFRPQGGRQLPYVTARTVMNRLDEVVGFNNWWDDYTVHERSVKCQLTIALPDGTTLTKSDAGGNAGMSDAGDDEKSGFSDAFKRAAAKFGIGRHLYGDGVPDYVATKLNLKPEDLRPAPRDDQQAPARATAPGRAPIRTDQPPSRAPGRAAQAPPRDHGRAAEPPARNGRRDFDPDVCPRNGKGLWAWAAAQQQDHAVEGLIDFLNNHGKSQSFPDRIIEWNQEETQDAWDAWHGTVG